MKTLEIHVPDEIATRLEEAARERGISVGELVRATLEDRLAADAATTYVLEKNAELYRRLS